MGIDFIRRAAPSFHKGLDRRRIELGTPTLFSHQPASTPRAYAANIGDGQTLAAGEKLGVRLDGDCVKALRGLSPVATFSNPPAELVKALSDSHGEACGVVQQVHDMAKTAEINVC
jgi:hypothetical protein